MKKSLALLMAAVCLLLCACGGQQDQKPTETTAVTAPAGQLGTVGISLPEEDAGWQLQAQLLSQQLESLGYSASVAYAGKDASLQKTQLTQLIEEKVRCLIVAAVDAYVLTDVLEQAKLAGISVVAYDRMLMYTDAADLCVQPDSYAAGQALARYILRIQSPNPEAPKTIEFFMGSPDNNNSLLVYRGVMDVLQPYLDSGALVCRSGRTGFEDTYIPGDSVQTVVEYCYDYLTGTYDSGAPDIFCCATDALAQGCAYALTNFPDKVGKTPPMIASVGGSLEAVARISGGQQAATVCADLQELTRQCAQLTDQLLRQEQLPQTENQSNGIGETPCCLLPVAVVDSSNYGEKLLDTGIYTQQQLDEVLNGGDGVALTVPSQTRPGYATMPATKPAATKPTETTPGGTTPVIVQPGTTPAGTEPPATDPPETAPTNPAPGETKPAQSTPADTKPAETTPA